MALRVAIANIVFGVSIVIVSSFGWTFLCNCKMIMPIWFLLIDISSQIQKLISKVLLKFNGERLNLPYIFAFIV